MAFDDFLLKENGDFLLLETGDFIILDHSVPPPLASVAPTAKFGGGWFVMPKVKQEFKDPRHNRFSISERRREIAKGKKIGEIIKDEINFKK